jgi:hypothetical protein
MENKPPYLLISPAKPTTGSEYSIIESTMTSGVRTNRLKIYRRNISQNGNYFEKFEFIEKPPNRINKGRMGVAVDRDERLHGEA